MDNNSHLYCLAQSHSYFGEEASKEKVVYGLKAARLDTEVKRELQNKIGATFISFGESKIVSL